MENRTSRGEFSIRPEKLCSSADNKDLPLKSSSRVAFVIFTFPHYCRELVMIKRNHNLIENERKLIFYFSYLSL